MVIFWSRSPREPRMMSAAGASTATICKPKQRLVGCTVAIVAMVSSLICRIDDKKTSAGAATQGTTSPQTCRVCHGAGGAKTAPHQAKLSAREMASAAAAPTAFTFKGGLACPMVGLA